MQPIERPPWLGGIQATPEVRATSRTELLGKEAGQLSSGESLVLPAEELGDQGVGEKDRPALLYHQGCECLCLDKILENQLGFAGISGTW